MTHKLWGYFGFIVIMTYTQIFIGARIPPPVSLKALETSKSGPGWQDADRWGAGDRFLPLQAIVAGGSRYRIVSPDLILQQSQLAKCKSFESTGPCQVLSLAPVLPLMYFGIESNNAYRLHVLIAQADQDEQHIVSLSCCISQCCFRSLHS